MAIGISSSFNECSYCGCSQRCCLCNRKKRTPSFEYFPNTQPATRENLREHLKNNYRAFVRVRGTPEISGTIYREPARSDLWKVYPDFGDPINVRLSDITLVTT